MDAADSGGDRLARMVETHRPSIEQKSNGARRYRALLEERGAIVPPDGDDRHLPRARFHAALVRDLRPVDEILPLYLRVPDADRSLH